jgi:HEAT repeat protein
MADATGQHDGETASADTATINQLIARLENKDGVHRQEAREQLVEIGSPAVPYLIKALQSGGERVRWEATKALAEIRDPWAAPALVQTLEDDEAGIRWLAATGLISLGRASLRPLLEALEKHSDSMWMREGTHRVLHALIREGVAEDAVPVLEALEDIEPAVEVPIAAYYVLHKIKRVSEESEPEP